MSDLHAAVAWYTYKLDFRVTQSMTYGDLTFCFISPAANDDFRLELLAGAGAGRRPPYEDMGDSLKLLGWHHVGIDVDSADDTVAELKRRGVTIVLEPMDVPQIGRRVAFFADPWGNLFELLQPLAA